MPDTTHRFLGLRENPFNITPDPRFLVQTGNVRQVFADLTHAIHAHKGLILLTGDVGTGKTILVHHLLAHLEKQGIPSSFIFNSHLDVDELFRMVLADFEIAGRRNTAPLALLQDWLAERGRMSGNAVLIIDEAQGLSLEVLEEIRLLLDMEAARGKALQVILVGQREFDEKLKRLEYRAIRQRIAVRCTTLALGRAEAEEYISGRLRAAGAGAGDIQFSQEASDLLYFYSRGVPRVLNLLCESSALYAHAAGAQAVSGEIVEEAAHQLQFDDYRPVGPNARRSRAAVAGAAGYDSGPASAPAWELPAQGQERIEKKYPVIQFPEALALNWTATPEAVSKQSAEKAKINTTAPKSDVSGVTVSEVKPEQPNVAVPPVGYEDQRLPEAPTVERLVEEEEVVEVAPAARMLAAVPAKPKTESKTVYARKAQAPLSPRGRARRGASDFSRSVRLTLNRAKRDIGDFGHTAAKSAARFAASMHREGVAWLGKQQSWNRMWDDVLRWLQEPIGGGKPHRSVSHKTAFPPPGD